MRRLKLVLVLLAGCNGGASEATDAAAPVLTDAATNPELPP